MRKEDILKIVQDGWEEYKTRILPNTYLYLYNDGQGIKTKQRRTSKRAFIPKRQHIKTAKSKSLRRGSQNKTKRCTSKRTFRQKITHQEWQLHLTLRKKQTDD